MRNALLLGLTAFLCAAASPSRPARVPPGPKAEDRLRRFFEADARLKARLNDAARREEAFIADARESELRDSVSGLDGEELRQGLERSPGEGRRRLLEGLPGMRMSESAPTSCLRLADCAVPELALEVPDAERLAVAMRRLVRPWLLLQGARGSELELLAVEGPGDAILIVRLKDLDEQPIVLNVSPRLLGGFKVWFDRPLVLAALYGREREHALARAN